MSLFLYFILILNIKKSNINKLKDYKNFMTLIYITCKDKNEAKKIATHLLKKRLIACANIFPIRSMYWWKNNIVNDNENLIIAKTNNKNFNKVAAEVKKMHSYKIPCILKINAKANKEYETWANKEMR